MARNFIPTKKSAPNVTPAKAVASSTPVRNSPIPKVAAAVAPVAAKKIVTHDMIAVRAYEISRSGSGGSDFDNWLRAERELRGR
jgi:hypothetical protein